MKKHNVLVNISIIGLPNSYVTWYTKCFASSSHSFNNLLRSSTKESSNWEVAVSLTLSGLAKTVVPLWESISIRKSRCLSLSTSICNSLFFPHTFFIAFFSASKVLQCLIIFFHLCYKSHVVWSQ